MAAGPVGSVWAHGTWTDTCWTANTWADAVVVIVTPSKQLPTRLAFTVIATSLGFEDTASVLAFEAIATELGFLALDGELMSTPLRFARTETGPITVLCSYVDGTVENLSTASSATLKLVKSDGTVAVNGVALTSLTSAGTGIWTRLTAQVASAGDYLAQVTVTRADSSIGIFPDAQTGIPVTILALVGD